VLIPQDGEQNALGMNERIDEKHGKQIQLLTAKGKN